MSIFIKTPISSWQHIKPRGWPHSFLAVTILLSSVSALSPRAHAQTYPLEVSSNGRYLVDQSNVPFFYHADTAWQLFTKLTLAEAEQYLEDRRTKGFTALQVQILSYAPGAALTTDGEEPFINNDMTKPNDAYFEHVDWVVSMAQKKGLLMVMSTAWFGYQGSGWRNQVTTASARAYGRYLGKRYQNFNNIVWIQGGDNAVEDKLSAVRELAAGIEENAPHHLQTYHNNDSLGSSASELRYEKWLDINMTYTRGLNYEPVLSDYNQDPVRPIVEGENLYLNETEQITDFVVRRQAYWVMLSGAAGDVYGIDPVWNFERNWKERLNHPSAFEMGHLKNLFEPRAWYNLVPDQDHTVVTDGYGTKGEGDYVTAARTNDGSLAIAYVPTRSRTLTVDLSKLRGSVTARWYDPTNGSYTNIGTFANQGIYEFISPDFNSTGDGDFVLVLEA